MSPRIPLTCKNEQERYLLLLLCVGIPYIYLCEKHNQNRSFYSTIPLSVYIDGVGKKGRTEPYSKSAEVDKEYFFFCILFCLKYPTEKILYSV